jgi:hypothetical protein
MMGRVLLAGVVLGGLLGAQDDPKDLRERLTATVSFLASDEMKGRRVGTPEGEKASRWMAEQFEKIGLKKVGPDGYFQKFKSGGESAPEGLNVLGLLEGTGDEFVALCCHHDHVGVRDGKIHNGADDNASGCAVLLEVARQCAAAKEKPRRSLLFCSFDGEERMLSGSRFFVNSGLVDMTKVAALICMDMMGSNFFPRDVSSLYVLGAENSPEIAGVLGKIPKVDGFEPRRLGINLIEPMGEAFARSDYGSFRLKKVPFVFLSTGQPWTYHKPEDDVERLNLGKMEKAVGFVRRLLLDLAALEARPRYVKQEGLSLDDLRAISETVRRFLEHPEDLDVKEEELAGVKAGLARIDEILKAGAITPADSQALQTMGLQLMTLAARKPKSEK